jgi:DNA-cytosine methyltransferase
MKILSLFDGISCARVALDRAGLKVDTYYASEIDKYAILISQKNYPDIVQLGSVVGLTHWGKNDSQLNGIDLLIGGSPCQDLSIAKKNRKGLAGDRSGLFWEYVRILKEVKPKYFILENVASMSKESQEKITETLGVQPIMINAALLSAQNRKRLFWTNIPGVTQPKDKGIFLKDILESGDTIDEKSLCVTATYHKKNARDFLKKRSGQMVNVGNVGGNAQSQRVYDPKGKSVTLSAGGGGMGAKTGLYIIQTPRGRNPGGKRALDGKTPVLTSSSWEQNNKLFDDGMIRKLSPVECERLQCLPDNYTAGISNTQRYTVCGNAFNVDVIAHILSFIPKQ